MKKYVIIFMLLSTSAFSQINLSIHLERSQSDYSITYLVDTLKIYKGNSLYKTIPYPNSSALLENVTSDIYKFSYKNLFGEQIEKFVDLRQSKNILGSHTITLYVDKLQNPKSESVFLNNLKNGESLIIRLLYSGCFDSGEESIKIVKKQNIMHLEYKGKNRKLKKINIAALAKYEIELRNLPKPNIISTSNAEHQIIIGNNFFSYSEPETFWGGFYILKKSLKL